MIEVHPPAQRPELEDPGPAADRARGKLARRRGGPR